ASSFPGSASVLANLCAYIRESATMELLDYLAPSGVPLVFAEAQIVLIGAVSSASVLERALQRIRSNRRLLFGTIILLLLACWGWSSFFGGKRPLLPPGTASKAEPEIQVISTE